MSYYPNVYASQTGPLALSTLDANFNFAVDIQSQSLYAAAGGTSDAITATYTPTVTTLISGLTLYLKATAANTTTTPTFAPNGLTAKTIVKYNNQALAAGDIAGAGHILILQYDATNSVWELVNPSTVSILKISGLGTGVGTALGIAVNTTSGGLSTIDGTATLTNKRVNPRFLASTANSATPTINTDNYDIVVITAQSVAITSFTTNLTGTPVNGQKLWISVTGTTAIAITWGASFESSTITLPSTTVTTARLDVGFVWNVATSKWRCVAMA